MKKDNNGLSLVEIIIVTAIIAIISTGAVVTYHQLGYAKTIKSAKLIDEAMGKARSDTISKVSPTYVHLYNTGGKSYMKVSSSSTLSVAGTVTEFPSNIKLSYKLSGVSTVDINDGVSICIGFKRGSGAFNNSIEQITIKSNNNTSIIKCVDVTGRHWVE